MTGSEFVYIPVEANAVMPMDEGGSGIPGYNLEGKYINWDYDGGIINRGWDAVIKMQYSPFEGYTVEKIQETIQNESNLNSVFAEWGKKYGFAQQDQFMHEAHAVYGYYDPEHGDTTGCIGAQIV